MTPVEIKTTILNSTGQRLSAQLGAVEIGRSAPEFDMATKNFEWLMIERIMPATGKILFASVCPGITHCPSSALNNVKQVYKDMNGNEDEATMYVHYYFVSCLSATSVIGVNPFEKDAVHHMVINLEPSIKSGVMPMATNHLGPHSLDACAHVKALGELLKDATAAELRVLNIVGMME